MSIKLNNPPLKNSTCPIPIIELFLDAPRCVSTQKMIYGVSEGETAYISCMIDAKPKPDQILWYMNTTSGKT